jgi:hypothetical protein
MKEEAAAKLAEKIAQMIAAENQSPDVASLFASIEKLNHRLERLEAAASEKTPLQISTAHPSQDRFAVAEAIVDSLFEHHSKEKACTFEPSKPCDHCSMCNSRGF